MAKTLADYRDQARREFDDDSIVAAIPARLLDADAIVRRAGHAGLLATLGMLLSPLLGLAAAAATRVVRVVRSIFKPRGIHSEGALDANTSSVLFILRPDRIDVHDFRIGLRYAGPNLGTLNRLEHPARFVDTGEYGEAIIEFGDAEWIVRPRYVRAFRRQLELLGYDVESTD